MNNLILYTKGNLLNNMQLFATFFFFNNEFIGIFIVNILLYVPNLQLYFSIFRLFLLYT